MNQSTGIGNPSSLPYTTTDTSSGNDAALVPAMGTCLLCHTVDPTITPAALDAGANWRCARCGQMWDAARLHAAAAYLRYVATH